MQRQPSARFIARRAAPILAPMKTPTRLLSCLLAAAFALALAACGNKGDLVLPDPPEPAAQAPAPAG